MKSNFVKQGYHSLFINEHLERISLLKRISFIMERHTTKIRIPPVITQDNRFLPNTTKIIRKNWNITQINESFKEIFKNRASEKLEIYMLQTNENYKNIQKPKNKQNLEHISQYKL